MEFSVLVIAHGRAGHLQRLLDGVQRSTCRPQEVVVVYMDDPRPEPVACTLGLRIIHLPSLPHESGLPLARARNAAAYTALSERLVFLDVDCIPAQPALSELLEALAEHRGLVMAEPRYLRQPLESGPTPADQRLAELSVAHHARVDLPRNTPCDHHEMFWSLGFAIHARDFARLGGFNTGYGGYGGEDTDFALAARAQDLAVTFSSAVIFHQHHGVYKPPLDHFADIVQNAKIFRQRWGIWPMQGWLASFQQLGLINWNAEAEPLQILRHPTVSEIEQAHSLEPY